MKVISNEKLNHVSGGKGKSFEGECKSKETKNKDGSTTKEWGCKVKIS